MNYRDRIIWRLAQDEAGRIARRVVRDLQRMKESLLSGDDSGLICAWDEVCAQVQGDPSFYWEAYWDTMVQFALSYAREVPEFTKWALWLQTDRGMDWESQHVDTDEVTAEMMPVDVAEIAEYIVAEHVVAIAASWSNRRVSAFLDQ